MAINFKKALKDQLSNQRSGEFVRITISGVDQEAYFNEAYPLELTFTDRFGISHQLRYQNDYIELDGRPTPLSVIIRMIYGINTPEGLRIAEAYETGFTRVADFLDPSDLVHPEIASGYRSNFVAKENMLGENRLRFHSVSPAGYPVATRDIIRSDADIYWESHGVLRIHPRAFWGPKKAVLVTWNPLAADFFSEHDIPAIPLPSNQELGFYNYHELLGGADIYIIDEQDGLNFDYSIYPFTELCLKNNLSVFRINAKGAFNQSSAMDYLASHGTKAFEERVRRFSMRIYPSDIPSKGMYNQSRTRRTPSIDLPQDVVGTRFFFKIDSTGDIAVSSPFRIISSGSLTSYENVQARQWVPFETVVTPEIIQRIENGSYMGWASIFDSTVAFIKRYIYLKEESWYYVLAAWVLGTYFYKAFPAYPYLHFEGERGSGKTTMLDLIAALSFNGVVKTKATVAAMTELVDEQCATLCVDEFEDFSSAKNTHDELSRFLNGGYNYKGTYTKKAGKQTRTLHTYSPKAFGGTGAINLDTLSSRTIPIPTIEKPKSVSLDEFMEFEPEVLRQQELTRTAALAFPLLHSKELFTAIEMISPDQQLPYSGKKLGNRQFQLAKPLLVIGALVDEDAKGASEIKQTILEGLDSLWNNNLSENMKLELVLANQFKAWSEDPDFTSYLIENDFCYFSKEAWDGTTLRDYFPDNTKLYKWFKDRFKLKTASRNFPHLTPDKNGNKNASYARFPLNLIIAYRPFREWFSKK